MPTRFSIVSDRACFGVMSAGIRDLKKCWEENYGFALKYDQSCAGELTEYERPVVLIEPPAFLPRVAERFVWEGGSLPVP